jgi:hypothetical protein
MSFEERTQMSDQETTLLLMQRWMHSYEEDTETEQVFRPSDYDFPPSRGRTGFECKSNGILWQFGPGPSDRPQAKEGAWELAEGDVLFLSTHSPSAEKRCMKIVALEKDKLVLKKVTC